MPVTYTPIATNTLSSTSALVTFSSIPSTYTDLVVIVSGKGTSLLQVRMSVNNDSSVIYSTTGMSGNGTGAESWRVSGYPYVSGDYYYSFTPNAGYVQFNLMNYSNTTTFKSFLTRSGEGSQATMANVSLWRSTAAINRIDITASTSTFAAGTVFTIYGIKAA